MRIGWAKTVLVGGVCLAACVSLAQLAGAGPARPWHEVMPPFAQRDVVIVYALATLPLLLAGARLLNHVPYVRVVGWVAAIGVAYFTLTRPQDTAVDWADPGISPFWERLGWVIAWQFPWALGCCGSPQSDLTGAVRAAPSAAAPSSYIRRSYIRPREAGEPQPFRLQLASQFLLALAVPALYVAEVHQRLGRHVGRLVARQQLWEAWQVTGRWSELGPGWGPFTQPQSNTPRTLHHELTQQLAIVVGRTAAELPPAASAEMVYRRAADLASLGREAEAQIHVEQLLNPTHQRSPQNSSSRTQVAAAGDSEADLTIAALRLQAELAARRGVWDVAARACEEALARLPNSSPAAMDLQETTADYWRRAGEYQRAAEGLEAAQRAAASAGNVDQARCAILLGDHHRSGGRPFRAAAHYQEALHLSTGVSAAAEIRQRAQTGLRELAQTTPWCLWPRARPVSR